MSELASLSQDHLLTILDFVDLLLRQWQNDLLLPLLLPFLYCADATASCEIPLLETSTDQKWVTSISSRLLKIEEAVDEESGEVAGVSLHLQQVVQVALSHKWELNLVQPRASHLLQRLLLLLAQHDDVVELVPPVDNTLYDMDGQLSVIYQQIQHIVDHLLGGVGLLLVFVFVVIVLVMEQGVELAQLHLAVLLNLLQTHLPRPYQQLRFLDGGFSFNEVFDLLL
mmetsp:Transcript_30588/g.30034  ORF Transcript_30588/g.30034 Transcript_30588/m.30034 type:complete len:226 (-) Transcript_30588:575-1252(-)